MGTAKRVGTAGWTLPRAVQGDFDAAGSHLARYAVRFAGVEINSTFYRPHRAATYARWAASVPDGFRFSLKLPKEITHVRRLVDVAEPLERFLDESAALGAKRDVVLVQLPPSFAFDRGSVDAFFALLRSRYDGRVACEPRNAGWFEDDAAALLAAYDVARVAADPAPVPAAASPGGSASFRYWRWHGSPVIYRSAYESERLAELTAALASDPAPAWCIFDNTTFGAATANALSVVAALADGDARYDTARAGRYP